MTLVQRSSLPPLVMPFSLAVVGREVWVARQTGTHGFALASGARELSFRTDGMITAGPMLAVLERTMLVVWQQEERGQPTQVMALAAGAPDGPGKPFSIAQGDAIALTGAVGARDRAFVTTRRGGRTTVHRLRLD